MNAALRMEDQVATESVGALGTLTWLGHATVLLTTMSRTRIVLARILCAPATFIGMRPRDPRL